MSISRATFLKTTATVAVVAVIAVGAVAVADSGGSKNVTVTAMFTDASPLIPGNLVHMDGIDVGQIKSVELRGGQAAVTMNIEKSVLPLHDDASATIRPVTLLGERYVDIDRGSDNSPVMSDPQVITVKHTNTSVDLDQVLDSLDDPTSTALAALVTTLGEGVNGQGTNVSQAIKALAPAMENTKQLATILDQQNSVLNQLVDRTTPVAKSLAGKNGQNLDQAVTYAKQLLASVSAQHEAMTAALQQLPSTLQKAQHTLSQVAGVADQATPVLKSAKPVTDNLSQITSELNAFDDSAKPAITSLNPVLDKAKSLLDQAQPVVRDLRNGGPSLVSTSASANRLVGGLSPKITTVMEFVKDWALSTNGRDALSNYFRAFVVTTPKGLLQIPGVGLGGTAPTTTSKSGTSATPKASATPSPTPSPSTSSLLPTPSGGDNSATGLTPTQENSLLGQILGGL
ncbi:MlaD family protein [Actinacidiphila oryziradicis]|uniref:MCE family protein n=1 Tax=Actinacidiphila oryziradicis TaxID=2571141 RepID=A0A4U0SC02_9ACTN|nr:MlaD family protein [Actinacidiphila oryziradicis]TKA01044.1 MCE family protein [Actinacidiphila oryziradicis]TKA04991.1 MCE family protein [Actinacidiphila oryziradicis]